ncbi:AraC-type DNA-binding protein [Lentibacillus halodurans]|uniref:AraC-type DNA-binding protein n=1 Tax=Lentibacillus halodurans TaxID=237679 RepID=A0A1I1AF09_9BACI|nr:AraC family transcriptional regulator [Lentibacillus halodurans]SFB36547.1 AraC-type DNA-binding protein [Lentibacillus halodurans]
MSQDHERTEWEAAVERVLEYIHHHLDGPIALSDLAAIASYSPYHLTKIFNKVTGISPLYYISAVRIQNAKTLLLNTNLTIRDICLDVGYQSLGSFTSSFMQKVGMTPAQYRAQSRQLHEYHHSMKVHRAKTSIPYGSDGSVVCGWVTGVEQLDEGIVLVGLFKKPVPEGLPAYFQLLKKDGFYRLANICSGTYYLMASSIAKSKHTTNREILHNSLYARWGEPFAFDQGFHIREGIDLALRPRRNTDPPILVSLSLLMKKYIQQRNSG